MSFTHSDIIRSTHLVLAVGDYREMYPEDPYGAEAGENARVWRVYLDESGEFDDDMIRGSKDMLDVHLVFVSYGIARNYSCLIPS